MSGCKKKADQTKPDDSPETVKTSVNYSFADFTLENIDNKDYIFFNIIADSDDDVNVKFFLVYKFHSQKQPDQIISPTSELVDKQIKKGTTLIEYRLEIVPENYDKYLFLNVSNVGEDYDCINTLDDTINKSVLSIALDVLSKDENNEIAIKIDNLVNAIEVSSIEISIDYDNKTAQALGSGYVIDANFNDDFIIIEIIFSPKAKLENDFDKLPVKNGMADAKGSLYIDNNRYYYKEEVEKTNNELTSITVTLDYLKHYDEKVTDEYIATMSNPEYNKITVTITLKNDYKFSSKFMLTLNDKLIDGSKYKIENNVLTYIFDDPNWSEFY